MLIARRLAGRILAKLAPSQSKVVAENIGRAAWISAIAAVLAGCSKVDHAEWREEVQLATGEIVVVNRVAIRDKSGFPSSARGPLREWTVVFPDRSIVWTSDGLMHPIAVEVSAGHAYVAANIRSPEYCKQFGDPPSSVLFFRWAGKAWERINRGEFPANGKENLLRNPWGLNSAQDASGLIRDKDKNLAKAYNNGVNDPLAKTLSSDWIDACSMFKKN